VRLESPVQAKGRCRSTACISTTRKASAADDAILIERATWRSTMIMAEVGTKRLGRESGYASDMRPRRTCAGIITIAGNSEPIRRQRHGEILFTAARRDDAVSATNECFAVGSNGGRAAPGLSVPGDIAIADSKTFPRKAARSGPRLGGGNPNSI